MPAHRLVQDLGLKAAECVDGDKLFYMPAATRHLIEFGTGDPTTTANSGMIYVALDEAADDSFIWARLGDGSAYTQVAVT